MDSKATGDRHRNEANRGFPGARSAMPGRGGLVRIKAAFWNTVGGIKEGLATDCIAFPLSFFIASDLWTWTALIASLLLVLSIEFLNTAIERLCNHIQPEKHDAIRITKDLASAGVFFALCLVALVWIAAAVTRFAY
jgi:diacylglycerol kinase (ATP)